MLRFDVGPPALGWIVNAMIEAGGGRNGLVCGFMHEIAEHAAVGRSRMGLYIDPGDRGPAA